MIVLTAMKNAEVAKVFSDISDLLELKGESPFKIRAYQKAARSIEYLPRELELMIAEGEDLRKIHGIGDAIASKTTELVTTGRLGYYDDLKTGFPDGLVVLLGIPGVGPKTANKLVRELGVKSVDELEVALRDGRVAKLFRLGDKTAENLLRQIETLHRKDRRIPIGEALPPVEEILTSLSRILGVRNLCAVGSLRRFRETVGDIDLMGTAYDHERVIKAFTCLPLVRQVVAQGPTEASVILPGGRQADFRLADHDSFGSLLQYSTGSKQHNIVLREKGRRMGLKLSEYGIAEDSKGVLEKFTTEEAFYRRLGLQYIPPELREGQQEIDKAEQGTLPRLIQQSDIQGDLHMHSDWSDGSDSIEVMVRAARDTGYRYVAITDHSVGRGIARGLSEDRLRKQIEEIRRLNDTLSGIRVLSGAEVDIRADGSLDMSEAMLGELDVVVAGVHSAMSQGEEQMTRRVTEALKNPHVDILAHPTCRLLGRREAVAIDMEALFCVAAKYDKALEINAMPSRLDLRDIHILRARELGAKLVISTDAHRALQLGYIRFGVGIARRGWCEPRDVLNARPLEDVLRFFRN
ncbi:MAG: DNA polymerase/3'-5' exonuclease PolX [Chloroflexota bacterium]